MFVEVDRSRSTHLSFHGGNRTQDRGETLPLDPGAFQTEFLVQCLEQFEDREVEGGSRWHDGGCCVRVWLTTRVVPLRPDRPGKYHPAKPTHACSSSG